MRQEQQSLLRACLRSSGKERGHRGRGLPAERRPQKLYTYTSSLRKLLFYLTVMRSYGYDFRKPKLDCSHVKAFGRVPREVGNRVQKPPNGTHLCKEALVCERAATLLPVAKISVRVNSGT